MEETSLAAIASRRLPPAMLSASAKTYEAELVEDMLSLMASFSAKNYGKRSAERRKNK